jgi:hypothetical protein
VSLNLSNTSIARCSRGDIGSHVFKVHALKVDRRQLDIRLRAQTALKKTRENIERKKSQDPKTNSFEQFHNVLWLESGLRPDAVPSEPIPQVKRKKLDSPQFCSSIIGAQPYLHGQEINHSRRPRR